MEDIVTLGFLVLLQVVLGFDNLLYISLESKRAPEDKRAYVRKLGIGLAIGLRIVLLFVLISLIDAVQDPLFGIDLFGYIKGEFNFHSLIVLAGGGFILYTAMKEIWHMVIFEEAHGEHGGEDKEPTSVNKIIAMIVVMNLVFSFDSILSAMALTKVFWVMATAIIIGGVLMIWLADHVSAFLAKNRMYEVLGLFVLFIVGIMLLSEGGHLAHLELFGGHVETMSKTTFYFVITILVITDIVQGRYQKKLLAQAKAAHHHIAAIAAPTQDHGETAPAGSTPAAPVDDTAPKVVAKKAAPAEDEADREESTDEDETAETAEGADEADSNADAPSEEEAAPESTSSQEKKGSGNKKKG